MNEPLPLRDIHVPEAVNLWPLAPGWWLLLLVIVAIAAMIYGLRRYRQYSRLRRQAQQEIARILKQSDQHEAALVTLQQLSIALRRIGMSYWPRQESAGMLGRSWYLRLNHLAPSSPLGETTIQLLLDAPYRASLDIDEKALRQVCGDIKGWAAALPRGGQIAREDAAHV